MEGIYYDFKQSKFINPEDGTEFTGDHFKVSAKFPGAREAGAGSSTLKRIALTHTFLRGKGEEGRRQLLAELSRELSKPLRVDHPLQDILYSSTESVVQAAYDRSTDTIYMVADNLTEASVEPVLLHELGVHKGLAGLLGEKQHTALMKRMSGIEKIARSGKGKVGEFNRQVFDADTTYGHHVRRKSNGATHNQKP